MFNNILTALLYRVRGGFMETKAPKLLQHFKTIGMVLLSWQLSYMATAIDWTYWVSIILFWFALSWTDWIANFDPYTRLPEHRLNDDWYDKYVVWGYDNLGTIKTNLLGLSVKGLMIGLALTPILGWWSLHNVLTLPLCYFVGWSIDKKNGTDRNYAEWLYGLFIFGG